MKIEQLIVQYLYQNKKVTLQDIGTFEIVSDIQIPEDSDKDVVLPENTIQFSLNKKAVVDDGLVGFIMEQTRKIKPLAYSDLESFIILNKQFLNIGKPLIIEGLGTLQKSQDGAFVFEQATTSHVTVEQSPKIVTEKLKEKISFATPQRENNTSKNRIVLLSLVVLVLLASAVAIFFFLNRNEAANNETVNNSAAVIDTLPATKDTALIKPDSLNKLSTTTTIASAADTNSFYVTIRRYKTLDNAQSTMNKLTKYGKNIVMKVNPDSTLFQLTLPFKNPLSDTAHLKDSLSKFYNINATVILP
ncbi:hypothetical protein ACFOWM_02030 [Ferruginibacter yonginensis]|uniref:CCDC81-like prokaryotic HU domain-containing protein n=1 Tax=Ferruginibacter yonginensis TaxID=1310416 RepID=A0ABV8QRS4_9BACT